MTRSNLPDPTPAHYFAARLRRRQLFSYARIGLAQQAGLPWLPDLEQRLRELPAADPDLFLEAEQPAGPEPSAPRWSRLGMAPAAARGNVGVWHQATLDGSIRAVYAALRPFHLVVVGPGHLIELAERVRVESFTLLVTDPAGGTADRHHLLARLHEGHRRFFGAPTAYLFHAGPLAAWWVLELHRRLRGAFLLDLGSALDACVAERVVGPGWGRIHWQAVARHLGIDPGPGGPRAATAAPHPSSAPGRPRPTRGMPRRERRRAPLAAPPQTAPLPERLHEGDLERCLAEAVDPPLARPGPASGAPSRPRQGEAPEASLGERQRQASEASSRPPQRRQ